jgi:thiamine-phosphate pyrophosphorylase
VRGLYAIVDPDALARRGLEVLPFAEAILDAGLCALQLRDKRGDAGRTLVLLRALGPLSARAGVPLFANDRPDLALLAGAAGVHVGQEDVPPAVARAAAEAAGARLLVGLSTHDASQVDAALGQAIDYLAVGPIFPTSSKERPSPVVGLDGLGGLSARVRAARPGLPVVAIGGISVETAAEVGARCDAVAVIGALLPEARGEAGYREARDRAAAFVRALGGGGP